MSVHEPVAASGLCGRCGAPIDSRYFDESGFSDVAVGGRVVLARVELPRRFCGVLEYFAQFTDQLAIDATRVETPDLEWSIVVNRNPLAPYGSMHSILNPWGFGSFQTTIRLDDSAVVEFVLRVIGPPPVGLTPVRRAGGRVMGRYWYNAACADVDRYRS